MNRLFRSWAPDTDARSSPTRADDAPLTAAGRGRRGLMLTGLAAGCGLLPAQSWAGAQVEEPLADSVRSALSAAIAYGAPPKPQFDGIEARLAYLRWLGEMSERLKRQKSETQTRIEFLESVWYESARAGLEPALVMGLIQVESGFRKYVISSAGARGYMQVMPFWARLIGDGQASRLFHMQTNLRFGCVIMRHYLDIEKGNLYLALGRYNGSRGRPEYPNAVMGARKRWLMPGET